MENKNPGSYNYSPNSGTSSQSATQTNNQNYWSNGYYPDGQNLNNFYNPFPTYVPYPTFPDYSASIRMPISKTPEAYITVGKSRTKMFNNNVYIKDGTDFEIELFNPSTETVGVKFKINGQYISDSHLVLRPGKHMFLDRYINENRMFKYVTYTVENTDAAKEAVALNGNIQVEFYREYQPVTPDYTKTVLRSSSGTVNFDNAAPVNMFYCHSDLGGAQPGTLTTTSCTTDDMSAVFTDSIKTVTEFETGMVAKGGKSEIEFDTIDMTFEIVSVATLSFKLLPLSQKPIEPKDLVRRCTGCSTKIKKDGSFCHKCGREA